RRAWHGPLAAAGVVAAVVALTGGMAWLGHRTTSTAPRPPAPTPVRTVEVALAYVGSTPVGPRLFTEVHAFPDPHEPRLETAIEALMNNPPRDADYRNYLLATHTSAQASEHDGTITVTFGRPVPRSGLAEPIPRMVLQAVVRTVDLAVGSGAPVRFDVAGHHAATVLGVGTSEPVRAAPSGQVDSPVQIESPVVRGRHHPVQAGSPPSSPPGRSCAGGPPRRTAGSIGPFTAPAASSSSVAVGPRRGGAARSRRTPSGSRR
ncbi:MAG: GerMN domain-containing protein, partial [Marmoricola sp.]|nr:GerMN domain-containing protein [Marmoricola sp.]